MHTAAVWGVDELIAGVGAVDRGAALKALLTWVDLGVLKEDTEGSFRLLEVAEEPAAGASSILSRPGTCFGCSACVYGALMVWCLVRVAASAMELPPVASVQQQQGEQMRVYWKVRFPFALVCT